MQLRKLLISVVVVIIAFIIGYGDAIATIQSHSASFFTKISSYFSPKEHPTEASPLINEKQPTPAPNTSAKPTKDTKTNPIGFSNIHGQVPEGQEKKRSKYLDDLRERLKESQEEPSEENDQRFMNTEDSADVSNDEPEELPPAFTDPYAQFRRPPGSPERDQPSSFITDNESNESADVDDSVEEVSPPVDEEEEIQMEDQDDN